jgi:twitching motility protein PilT
MTAIAEDLLTPAALIDQLHAEGLVTEDQVVSALGAARHDATLAQVEVRLVASGLVSANRLLAIKGLLCALPTADDPTLGYLERLPADVARTAGALVVDRSPLTVAFVEPVEANVSIVARTLGTPDFEVWLTTTSAFQQNLASVYGDKKADRRPHAADLFELFDETIRRRASDLHLEVGRPPMLRIDGSLTPTQHRPLEREWLETQLPTIADDARLAQFRRSMTLDFAYAYGTNRFRVNLGMDRRGPKLVGRLLPSKLLTMDDLALPSAVRRFTELERGLVLVTGQTGSGKTTLLAALLAEIARNQSRHLITLEDPIEYVLTEGPNAVVSQRELGVSFLDFADALRQALRQDPDCLLIGEIRDSATAEVAVEAADTGHLVFATLHTSDAQSTVSRLVSMFNPTEQEQARIKIAYLLKGIVSQMLVPRAASAGRVAAMEILIGTPSVANNLRRAEGVTQLRSTLSTSRKEGMQTMEMALADLVRAGTIRQEEAEVRCRDLDAFFQYLRGATAP